MYGYESSLDYTPATEGIGDWARGVLDWIREQGKNIKAFIDKIVAKIKKFMHKPTADEYKKDSENAPTLINEISDNIGKLIRNCVNSIKNLYDDYEYSITKGKPRTNTVESYITDADGNETHKSSTVLRTSKITAHKGMGKLYEKENKLSAKDKEDWNTRKESYYKEFADYSKIAVELREKLTELSGMALSYNALKTGYTTLKSIFGMNGKFGAEWAAIVVGHDWSTGEIRKYLNNVVKMYKTGINATNALGRKLSATKTRDDNGKPIDNPNEMEYNKKKDTEKAITARYMRKAARKNGDDRKAYTDERYEVSEDSVSIFDDDYFAAEDCDIYDEEIDMALENAYDDGYFQALADMDYDGAMEGNPENKAKRKAWEKSIMGSLYKDDRTYNDHMSFNPQHVRHGLKKQPGTFRGGFRNGEVYTGELISKHNVGPRTINPDRYKEYRYRMSDRVWDDSASVAGIRNDPKGAIRKLHRS